MVESFQIALRQAEEMLSEEDLSSYDDVIFVGKSVGTIVAANIAAERPAADRIRLVLYTPLEDTFAFLGESTECIAFTGANDPWVGAEKSRISKLCQERQIPCTVIPGANHSLESDNLQEDIRNMQLIMKETEEFIRGKSK